MKAQKKYEPSDLTFSSLLGIVPPDLYECIQRLKLVDQRVDRHPEGNVFVHTQVVVDRVAKYGDIELSIAALLHDEGKSRTTSINPKTGMPRSPGHEKYSAECVIIFSDWIRDMGANSHVVYSLVLHHMDKDLNDIPSKLVSDKMMQHLQTYEWYPQLVLLMTADHGGTDID